MTKIKFIPCKPEEKDPADIALRYSEDFFGKKGFYPTEDDCVRIVEEARVAIDLEEKFAEKYGREPDGCEKEEIDRKAAVFCRYRRKGITLTEQQTEYIASYNKDENKEEIPMEKLYEKKYETKIDRTSARRKASEDFAKGKLIIAKDCTYSLNDYETKLNNNVLVVGGSGTGKTRTIVTPNIHEAVGSYIISDPKGNLHKKYGAFLRKKGYKIKVMDFTHPERSAHYNPMFHLKTSQDILRMTSLIVDEQKSCRADPFWDQMTTIYLAAIVGYMLETEYKPFDFKSILRLMNEGKRDGDDDDNCKSSELAKKFIKLRITRPDSWACSQFDSANAAPNKTYDTIRATLAAKFATFDTAEVRAMMNGNDFEFSDLGKEKTALFVIVSDTDRSMDSLVNIFFTQAMQELCAYADNECPDSRLPVPVRFILDDFATNCRIDGFPRVISTIRSRGISTMLMVQSEAQLEVGYGADADTIISNCDTYVYLGGNDVKTALCVSERCDRSLRQVLNMPIGSCWVFRRGSQPVYTTTTDPDKCITEMEKAG